MPVQSLIKKSTEIIDTKLFKKTTIDPAPESPTKLLDSIDSPADLRNLAQDQLPALASELRAFMLDQVSRHGGHLAPGLGVVELTIALHYVYQTPRDKLIWDVGHQAYPHKILTGRKKSFETLRQYGGVSGFPRISESPYDAVSSGHASTSISVGLGISKARDLLQEKFDVVSIIGDGALSGGLAFEGMNNLGSHANTKMVVVLNDNRMSIARNVGALSRYLTRVITDRRFNRIKTDIWELLGNLSNVGIGIRNLVHNVDEALKHFVIPGKLFEDLGLRYFGPVDGHDISEMVEVFKFLRDSATQPVLVHVLTTKGKGYRFAEDNATKFHGVGIFSLSTGDAPAKQPAPPTFGEVFGKTLVNIARGNKNVVAITAAMSDGTGLTPFREEFPDRFFDVGIAEAHAVTFAAGLAHGGMRPVVAIYSSFLQRSYDQIVHDVALDRLNVVFCVDRAGLVGEDGPTHHGMFDLSFLRTIPNVVIMAPRTEAELVAMLHMAVGYENGPVFIRYPRGAGSALCAEKPPTPLSIGKPEVLCAGAQCAIVAIGDACTAALEARTILAKTGVQPTVINARFAKPLSVTYYRLLCAEYTHIVTIEHNTLSGGFGSGVLEIVSAADLPRRPQVLRLGLPDAFVAHGDAPSLLKSLALDAESVARQIGDFVRTGSPQPAHATPDLIERPDR